MNRREAVKKAEDLVSRMTVEEAASQLRYDAPAIPRLGVPEYNWWNESLHGVARAGVATCFPQAIAMAATFDEKLVRQIGETVSLEARAKYNAYSRHGDRSRYKGVTVWAPNINIFRDPRWGRGQETFGEDPCLTSVMGCAMVKGLQKVRGGYMTTAACAKHFAVHSGPEALRHSFDARVTEKDLWETYLPAFQKCVQEAKVEAVMGAYNRTNGEVCCAHSRLMEQILRGEWKFRGHFVSDCWAVRDFHEHHKVTDKPEDSAALAIKKGCDLNCGCTYQRVMDAYQQKKLTEEEIRRSAVRLFTTRYLLGLFDDSALDDIPYEVVGCDKHRKLAYRTAVESCVLLKNSGILPLDGRKYRRIAVIGPNADSTAALVGNYFGTPPESVTLLEGIRQKCDACHIQLMYAEGSHLYKEADSVRPHENYRPTEAVMAAECAELAILCVGLDATIEGEQGDAGNEFSSGDKRDLLLPQAQRSMIEAVIAVGTPFILLNASGSPIDLSAYEEQAEAILQVWYPGGEGGRAVADILFGQAAPGGKLPVTFYYNDNDLPDLTDYRMTNRTYRYLKEKPWHGFGFGLTYGQLDITQAKFTDERGREGKCSYREAAEKGVNLSLTCKNPGGRPVSEVIQVYVHVNGTDHETPNGKLAAFCRIGVQGGCTESVSLHIPAESFTTVNEAGERRADGEGASIYAGFSQPSEDGWERTGVRYELQGK